MPQATARRRVTVKPRTKSEETVQATCNLCGEIVQASNLKSLLGWFPKHLGDHHEEELQKLLAVMGEFGMLLFCSCFSSDPDWSSAAETVRMREKLLGILNGGDPLG